MAFQFEISLKSLQTKFYFQIVSHKNSFEHITNEHRALCSHEVCRQAFGEVFYAMGDGRYKTRQIFLENVP